MNTIKNRKGFTLIELLVVITILGLLALLVAPKMLGRVGPAKQKAAQTQIALLETALDAFRLDTGRYPITTEGLQALRTNPGIEGWNGPYLQKEVPLDPWGSPYVYTSPGTHGDYDLVSLGADKAQGGEGENQDILNWKGLEQEKK